MEAKFNSKGEKITLIFLFLAILLISVSAVSATSNDSAQWSQPTGDNQNTGQSSYLGPQNNSTKFNHTFTENDSVFYGPVIGHKGTIYLGSYDSGNNMIKLDAINPNGSVKWTYLFNNYSKMTAAPVIGPDGTIYVVTGFSADGNYNSNLYALQDLGTSAIVKWNYTVTGYSVSIDSSPVVSKDGTIYFGVTSYELSDYTDHAKLYALNGNGSLKWIYNVSNTQSNYFEGSPAIGPDGTIYFNVGSWGNGTPVGILEIATLYALKDKGTYSSEKWHVMCGDSIYNYPADSPTIGPDGTIYMAVNTYTNGQIFAFKDLGTTYQQKWNYTLNESSSYITSGISVTKDKNLYFGFHDGDNYGLYALKDLGTIASKKLNFTTENSIGYAPIIGSDGTLYFGDSNRKPHTFYALTSNGLVKWVYHASMASSAAMAQDGTIYFVTQSTDEPIFGLSRPTQVASAASLIAIQGPSSGLYVKTTVDNPNPEVGDTVNVLFKAGNTGPDTAYNTILTYVVPKGLKFVKAWADVGTITYNPKTRTVTWNIGDVPVGDPQGHVQLIAETSGTFPVIPQISTSSYDPNISQNVESSTIVAKAASSSQNDTVGMQHTGIPLNYLIMAILLVIGGLIVPKRK